MQIYMARSHNKGAQKTLFTSLQMAESTPTSTPTPFQALSKKDHILQIRQKARLIAFDSAVSTSHSPSTRSPSSMSSSSRLRLSSRSSQLFQSSAFTVRPDGHGTFHFNVTSLTVFLTTKFDKETTAKRPSVNTCLSTLAMQTQIDSSASSSVSSS